MATRQPSQTAGGRNNNTMLLRAEFCNQHSYQHTKNMIPGYQLLILRWDWLAEYIEEQDHAFRNALEDLNAQDWVSKAISSLRSNGAEGIAESIRLGFDQAYRPLAQDFRKHLLNDKNWKPLIVQEYKWQDRESRGTKCSNSQPIQSGKEWKCTIWELLLSRKTHPGGNAMF